MNQTIKLINSQINNYKKLSNLTMDINDITSIIGENGVGKTSLLQAFSYIAHPNSEEPINIINTYIIDTKAHESLNDYDLDSELEIKVSVDSNQRYEIINIKGIDRYKAIVNKKMADINELILVKTAELLNIISKIKETVEMFSAEMIENHRNFNFFINPLKFDIENINKLVAAFDGYQNSKDIFEFDEKNLTIYNKELINSLNNFYGLNNNYEFINIESIKKFKEEYQDCTIEKNGIEIDFKGLGKYVEDLNKQYSSLKQLLNSIVTSYSEKQNEKMEIEEDIYNISRNVDGLRSNLITIIIDYCRNIIFMPSHIDIYPRVNKVDEDTKAKILNIIGLKINSKSPKSELSDGEIWCLDFAEKASSLHDNILLIDEPGMYLNPLLQSRLLKVFRYLNTKNIIIIFTTHSNFMIEFENGISNYILREKKGNINIKRILMDPGSFLNNITIGEIILYSGKRLIIVEGTNDMLLYRNALKKIFKIDINALNFIEGSGDAVISIIDFCMKNRIEFRALIDIDKKPRMYELLGKSRMDKNKKKIYFIGGDKDEVEDIITESDKRLLCRNVPETIEWKLSGECIKRCFSTNKYKQLSNKMKTELEKAFDYLQVI